VPSTVIDEGRVAAGESRHGRLKALVFLPSIAYYRLFEHLQGAMVAEGHEVLIALDREQRAVPPERAPLVAQPLRPRTGPWQIAASAIRRSLDYLRYLEPEYGAAEPPRAQARNRAPRAIRALLFLPPFRWKLGRRALAWLLHRVEAAIPRPRPVKSFISGQAPDVVVVSPLIEFGSAQADYVRSATAARIPSVLVVASEDDLIGRGVIRDVPTLTVTWSESGVNELVSRHGLPRERIVTVGAPNANDREAPAASGTAEAIERAAGMDVATPREGTLLRPLLWLLTPLLAILLLLLRPRATGRAAIRAPRRLVGRVRKLAKTLRRRRAEKSKARAAAAKAQRMSGVEEQRERKKARAEAKALKKARAEGEKPPKDKSASARNGGESASGDAKESQEKPRG
jgi:hypothetical protein